MGATNSWLTNKNFLKMLDFDDKYYLEELFNHLQNFIKVIPISVALSWDKVHNSIYVSVGADFKKFFPVSTEISYKDFCKLIENSIMHLYPRYEIDIEKEEYLSNDEIYDIVQKTGRDVQDVLHDKKIVKYRKSGVITKIYLTKDEFRFQEIENGVRVNSIRMSGNASQNNFINLSKFLKTLRNFQKDIFERAIDEYGITEFEYKNNNFNQQIIDFEKTFKNNLTDEQIKSIYLELENEKYNWINENSTFIREVDSYENDQIIDYQGKMMMNFFRINLNDLKDKEVIRVTDEHYRIGEYNILFSSDMLRKDCLEILKK